jgi:hypothetical protein
MGMGRFIYFYLKSLYLYMWYPLRGMLFIARN